MLKIFFPVLILNLKENAVAIKVQINGIYKSLKRFHKVIMTSVYVPNEIKELHLVLIQFHIQKDHQFPV